MASKETIYQYHVINVLKYTSKDSVQIPDFFQFISNGLWEKGKNGKHILIIPTLDKNTLKTKSAFLWKRKLFLVHDIILHQSFCDKGNAIQTAWGCFFCANECVLFYKTVDKNSNTCHLQPKNIFNTKYKIKSFKKVS